MSLFNTIIPSLHHGTHEGNGDPHPICRPYFEIDETEGAYGVTVYMPGVAKEGLEITAEGGELRITGKRATKLPEGVTALHRESSDAAFELVLTHDNTVNTGKIEAELKDGILRVALAKVESAKPRKIAIT
jgi:HSP20 family molecular chaperone IbpA